MCCQPLQLPCPGVSLTPLTKRHHLNGLQHLLCCEGSSPGLHTLQHIQVAGQASLSKCKLWLIRTTSPVPAGNLDGATAQRCGAADDDDGCTAVPSDASLEPGLLGLAHVAANAAQARSDGVAAAATPNSLPAHISPACQVTAAADGRDTLPLTRTASQASAAPAAADSDAAAAAAVRGGTLVTGSMAGSTAHAPAAAAAVAAPTAGAPACGADASSVPPRPAAQPLLAGPFSPSLAARPACSMAPAGAAVARAESRTPLPTASHGPSAAAPPMQLTAEMIRPVPPAVTASPLPGLTAQVVMLLQLLCGLQAATPSAAALAAPPPAAMHPHEASHHRSAEAAAGGAAPTQQLSPAAQLPATPGMPAAATSLGELTPGGNPAPAAGCGHCGRGSGSRGDARYGSSGPPTADLPRRLLLPDLPEASPGAAAAAVAAAAAGAAVQAALGSISAAGTHTQLQMLHNCSAEPPASHPPAQVQNPHHIGLPSRHSYCLPLSATPSVSGGTAATWLASRLTAQGIAGRQAWVAAQAAIFQHVHICYHEVSSCRQVPSSASWLGPWQHLCLQHAKSHTLDATTACLLLQASRLDQLAQYRAVLREELQLLPKQASSCGLNMSPTPRPALTCCLVFGMCSHS
jgi:hypothetical protein